MKARSRELLDRAIAAMVAVLRLRHKAEILASGDNEALFRTVLEHYGFTRLTKSRKEYLSRVLQLASGVEGGKS
ncbi:MAG: hypothetical protein ACPL7K_01765 [Armatimonadota bacterium]|jgi:hypothetical protein